MIVRSLTRQDADQWVALRHALWSDTIPPQLAQEVDIILADAAQAALGLFDGDRLLGFAEVSLHPHAIGCRPGPVAYLEGWYVAPDARRQGIGGQLVAAAETWGRQQGCTEMASDTWLENTTSHTAHLALGFAEASRLIHYRKVLG